MITPIILIYVGISIMVALFAFGRRISFAGVFFTSVLLSPLVGIFAILKTDKNIRVKHYTTRYVCPKCNIEYAQEKEFCTFCLEMGEKINIKSTRVLL